MDYDTIAKDIQRMLVATGRQWLETYEPNTPETLEQIKEFVRSLHNSVLSGSAPRSVESGSILFKLEDQTIKVYLCVSFRFTNEDFNFTARYNRTGAFA